MAGFVLRRPPRQTRIPVTTRAERDSYDHRILERLGLSVHDYSVLNIHRIGIAAPIDVVWRALSEWQPSGGYWPNHLAEAVLRRNLPNHIEIFLLGRRTSLFGLRNGFLGLNFIPLFHMDILKRQAVPSPEDPDRTRYLIYSCSGGYPMGVFSIYVRSPIATEEEHDPAQLIVIVSFDFFGWKNWLGTFVVRPIWESVHNRVTANWLNRFKRHCERLSAEHDAEAATADSRSAASQPASQNS